MAERRFSMEDQHAFARLSGDFNPVHVDALAARRVMFGTPIVHGAHLLLWALTEWSAAHPQARPTSLKGRFMRPVHVDDQSELTIAASDAGRSALHISVSGARAASFQISWTSEPGLQRAAPLDDVPVRADPQNLTAADLEARPSGFLDLHWPAEARKLFGGLEDRIGTALPAVIATSSRLVGVACPGLHSVFAEIALEIEAADSAIARLDWSVRSWDPRFRYTDITVSGAGMTGTIGAFLRPEPRQQPGMADLRGRVAADAFADQRALVVGGSRGLGEVTAKLLATGGAEVVLSYAQGAEDAEAIAADIRAAGGQARTIWIDVMKQAPEGLSDLDITHLYYFATPFAFSGRRGRFGADLFSRFCAFYVDGFLRVFDAAGAAFSGVFYPSSVAIDEMPPDMGEYVAAKLAGEAMCRHLAASHPKTVFAMPRLPRLDTDQTQSLSAVDNADPVPLLSRLLTGFAA